LPDVVGSRDPHGTQDGNAVGRKLLRKRLPIPRLPPQL
jgi:hypothetical protein